MASSSSFLSEDQLQCSICLDVFTDPVSTPCGHNFCMMCLKKCWDTSSHCQCPVCKMDFPKRPKLHVNTFISGLAAQFRKPVQVKSSSTAGEPTKSRVYCDICSEKKYEALKSCLICMASYCETHLEPHQRVPSLKKHKLINPVENMEDYICQKHERPLEMFCKDDQMCVCQVCTLDDHKNHNTVPMEVESGEKKAELGKTQAEVQQMIEDRLKKIEAIKHCVEVKKKNTEKEKTDNMEIFRALIRSIERNQAEMLKVMEENQRAADSQAEEFIKDLEQEITELKSRNTELGQISNTEDHLHLLQIYPSLCRPPPTNNWTDVSIQAHLDVDPLFRTKLMESFDKKMKKLAQMVDVTLDADTADPELILSDDGKQVTCGDKRQNLPDNPERFTDDYIVLGKEGFSSGRFYYEVQVSGKTVWLLGLVTASINRKESTDPTLENGFWCLSSVNEIVFCPVGSVVTFVKQAPQKVGVFVDYEEGLVSFYDLENECHICDITGQSFTEKLYPVFSPGPNDDGENSAPLIICPVSQVHS
ncbi:E3 ubiquitin-protein ligase TRIM39-like isoform X2 [Trichomycterus rosablanca]|uniref:E3 ubiquitin-protein ligase TRIM39-like isoform X2 n=1 Tax=Trichomycterus rosablanca TaxID=2290929 RepID=UPI002F35DF7A